MTNVKNTIQATNGRAFSVEFQKADGSIKNAVARIGVKKYLKGGVATYNGRNNDAGNIGVFIFERDALGRFCGGSYRAIKEKRTLKIKCNHKGVS